MNIELIFKVLSNPVRVKILEWLREPDANFPFMIHLPEEEQGKGYVCVSMIQEKTGITQSTVSHYLNLMGQSELLTCKRMGQWTFYRRNEDVIKKTARFIANDL
jgi:ArsR family transcriptional regulator